MRVKVKNFLNKKKENSRTNEKYEYTSVLCIFDDDVTAKWVRVPDYVCKSDDIELNTFADVYFGDEERTQATIFEPVKAEDVIKPATIDKDTGEILDE